MAQGADYLRTGIHDPDNNWLEIYENHDTFINMTADCKAPIELREIIWQAMQSTKEQMEETESGALRQRMSDTLSTVPSLEEFTVNIRKGYGGKASGMS